METTKAEQAGYTFEPLMDWFPGLVRGGRFCITVGAVEYRLGWN